MKSYIANLLHRYLSRYSNKEIARGTINKSKESIPSTNTYTLEFNKILPKKLREPLAEHIKEYLQTHLNYTSSYYEYVLNDEFTIIYDSNKLYLNILDSYIEYKNPILAHSTKFKLPPLDQYVLETTGSFECLKASDDQIYCNNDMSSVFRDTVIYSFRGIAITPQGANATISQWPYTPVDFKTKAEYYLDQTIESFKKYCEEFGEKGYLYSTLTFFEYIDDHTKESTNDTSTTIGLYKYSVTRTPVNRTIYMFKTPMNYELSKSKHKRKRKK